MIKITGVKIYTAAVHSHACGLNHIKSAQEKKQRIFMLGIYSIYVIKTLYRNISSQFNAAREDASLIWFLRMCSVFRFDRLDRGVTSSI